MRVPVALLQFTGKGGETLEGAFEAPNSGKPFL
jgi:hypothetical protein